jgi:hypothetical protein
MWAILLVARNSHTKQSGKVHCHDAENNPPNSIFHVIFTAFFPTDTAKCQCSNVGLVCPCGTNSWFTTVWMLKKQWALLLKFQWTCLAIFVQGDIVLFNLNCCLICRLYCKPVSSPVLIFKRNSGFLSTFAWRFWHVSKWFFCSSQQVVQKFGSSNTPSD